MFVHLSEIAKMNIRHTLLLFWCICSLACQENQKPNTSTKKRENQRKVATETILNQKPLDIQALLPKFKYKKVKHFTTNEIYNSLNFEKMGLIEVGKGIIETEYNLKLYYYAYAEIRDGAYMFAFLYQGMYGLEALVQLYDAKGKLIHQEPRGILDGGDMGCLWKRDILIDDDSTYRQIQIHNWSQARIEVKEHIKKLIDTTSFKMVYIDAKGQPNILIKKGYFHAP